MDRFNDNFGINFKNIFQELFSQHIHVVSIANTYLQHISWHQQLQHDGIKTKS